MLKINRFIKAVVFTIAVMSMGVVLGQEIRLEAPSTAYVNTPFSVKVMVSGGDFSDYTDPQFTGVRVLGRGSMTQIINFKKSQGYTYTVMAESEGTVRIGAASCVIKGTKYTSQPQNITIAGQRPQQQQRRRSPWSSGFDDEEDPFAAMQQQMNQMMQQMMDPIDLGQQQPTFDPADKNDENAIFAKISINKTNPYKGEQIILTYKIYTRIDFSLTGGFHAPEKKGFWSENLLLDQKFIKPQQEVINGKRYLSYELGREALYAQENGNLKIDVMDLPIQAVFYTSKPINLGFFTIQASQPDPQQITLKTNPLTVKVRQLPAKAPSQFDGAVGKFVVKGGVDKTKTRVNEAITYSLTVNGQGNLTLIDNPTIGFPNIFEVYDPDVEDKINRTANGISGSRTFKWVLIPRSEGIYEIPAYKFSYFDPTSGTYETVSVPEQKITIEKGDPKLMQNATSGGNNGVKEDINYIKSDDNSLKLTGTKKDGNAWFWMVAAIIVALSAGVYAYGHHRQEAYKDIAGMRLRRATREAQKRLRKASKYMDNGNDEKFYEEIYKAIWGCLADKFNISLSKLSSETVQDCLNEKAVPRERQDVINDTLKEVDFARFAPGDSSQKKHTIYDKALEMIRTLSFVIAILLMPLAANADDTVDTHLTADGLQSMPDTLPNTPEARLAAANIAYRAARYHDASAIYKRLVDEGYESHTLYYNYGNALYRGSYYAEAILYYEKALRQKPGDKQTRENLTLANTKIVDNMTPVPKLFVTKWHNNAVRNHSTTFWLVWVLVILAVICASVVVFLLTSNYGLRKAGFWVGVISLVILIPIGYTAIESGKYWNSHNEAIVMTTMINVKGSPDSGSVDKFVLHSGSKIVINDQIDNWLKITATDGNNGWIEEKDIERI